MVQHPAVGVELATDRFCDARLSSFPPTRRPATRVRRLVTVSSALAGAEEWEGDGGAEEVREGDDGPARGRGEGGVGVELVVDAAVEGRSIVKGLFLEDSEESGKEKRRE